MYREQIMPYHLPETAPYDSSWEDREWQMLKSWYSGEMLQMQEAVERACDELDYEGSWMYDEYPDRDRMEREQGNIQERLEQRQWDMETTEDMEGADRRPGRPKKIGDLLRVLWFNEVHRRRCRRRKCRDW